MGTTIFAEMSALAGTTGSVNLGQGFPDTDRPDEVARIAELACEHGLLVVSDEVYEHMVYDGIHVPIVSLPGMSERTVTISSAAKMFGFTGWKVGWVTASPELVTAVRTVKQFLTYVTGGPFQYAVAEALALPDDYYTAISADLRVK